MKFPKSLKIIDVLQNVRTQEGFFLTHNQWSSTKHCFCHISIAFHLTGVKFTKHLKKKEVMVAQCNIVQAGLDHLGKNIKGNPGTQLSVIISIGFLLYKSLKSQTF